jgi:CheY-like chemotaxis protein
MRCEVAFEVRDGDGHDGLQSVAAGTVCALWAGDVTGTWRADLDWVSHGPADCVETVLLSSREGRATFGAQHPIVHGSTGMDHRILVVEDQKDIADLIAMHVRDLGHRVDLVHDGNAGLQAAQSGNYSMVVLDVMLPGRDGLDVVKAMRMERNATPVLMLTARSSELDRVLGLELGADDYLTKPFSIPELQARVKAMLRRRDMAMQPPDDATQRIVARELSSTARAARSSSQVARCRSPRRSSTCSRISRAIRGGCSPVCNCSTRCGAPRTRAMNTTSTPTSTGCAPSSSPIPRTRVTS